MDLKKLNITEEEKLAQLEKEFQEIQKPKINVVVPPKKRLSGEELTKIMNEELMKLILEKKKIKKVLGDKNKAKRIKKELKKFNSEIRILPVEYKDEKVIQITIGKKKYTRDKIKDVSNKFSQLFKNQGYNGRIMTTLKYDKGYRSGYFTNIGDDVNLYQQTDSGPNDIDHNQNIFDRFDIFIVPYTNKKGGNDIYNDCFYNCLRQTLKEDNPWKQPEKFKEFLNIGRFDKVDLSHMPLIETHITEKLKYNVCINITGDYIYTSTQQSKINLHFILENEHYKLNYNRISKIKNVSYTERKPLIMCSRSFYGYNGSEFYFITLEERNNIYDFKTDYILIPFQINKKKKDKKKDEDEENDEEIIIEDEDEEIIIEDKENKDNDLEYVKERLIKEYNNFIHDADMLKRITGSKINLYKTGTNKKTALNLFDYFTKSIEIPEKIEQDEALWINKANKGALIYCEEYKGEAWSYDICSMYPHLLNPKGKNGNGILMPIKRGEFKKITSEEFNNIKNSFLPFGIYRCKIKQSMNRDVNKLFRFNFEDYYTHISIQHAQKLGLDIEIIEDEEPNILLYPSKTHCITSKRLLGEYINYMFDLKEKEVPRSKSILNIIWGALCEKLDRTYKKDPTDQNNIFKIPDNHDINFIKPSDDNKIIISHIKRDKYYKTNFARFSPFLLSKGRLMISDIMEPHIQYIKRFHTDGFISCKKLDIKTGNEIGNLKYEGYNNKICFDNIRSKIDGFDKTK